MIAGSIIGGMKETQECLDFCAKNSIKPQIEVVTMERLSEIYQKLSQKNDSVIRYVLDVPKSLAMD